MKILSGDDLKPERREQLVKKWHLDNLEDMFRTLYDGPDPNSVSWRMSYSTHRPLAPSFSPDKPLSQNMLFFMEHHYHLPLLAKWVYDHRKDIRADCEKNGRAKSVVHQEVFSSLTRDLHRSDETWPSKVASLVRRFIKASMNSPHPEPSSLQSRQRSLTDGESGSNLALRHSHSSSSPGTRNAPNVRGSPYNGISSGSHSSPSRRFPSHALSVLTSSDDDVSSDSSWSMIGSSYSSSAWSVVEYDEE